MHFTQVLALGAGLIMSAKAYDITIYSNVWNCQANDNSKYRIYTGNSEECINVNGAPPSDAQCSFYGDGGFSGPASCTGDNGIMGDSVYIDDYHTQVAGTNDCWSCQFFSASDCQVPTFDDGHNLKCQTWGGDGIVSFKCGPSTTIGSC